MQSLGAILVEGGREEGALFPQLYGGKATAMLFGVYLVENGVLSAEEFVEAVKLAHNSRPQIGALAIKNRMLSCRDVFSILNAQCDAPDERFGETAIRLGYLNHEELSQLLTIQSQQAQPFRELLIQNRFLPADVVERNYQSFRRCFAENSQLELANA